MISKRHLELSSKFIEMGQALMLEGHNGKDYNIAQVGSSMILLGSLILDEKNLQFFGQMCSMFSAKMILDNMDANNSDYSQYLKKKSSEETYEDFIKRLNKFRENMGDDSPIE